MVEFMTW